MQVEIGDFVLLTVTQYSEGVELKEELWFKVLSKPNGVAGVYKGMLQDSPKIIKSLAFRDVLPFTVHEVKNIHQKK